MKKTRSLFIAAAAIVSMFAFGATPASAVDIADGHKLYGYYQFWFALAEDSAKKTDPTTGKESGDSIMGFQERRALRVQGRLR